MDRALAGASDECPFNPSMLIAQRNFEMKDILAVTLEAKVAGLDNSGVHRADSNFVDLFPGHREEIGDTGNWCRRQAVAGAVGRVKSNRLQPGMSFWMNVPLLGDLALEPMSLRAFERQGMDTTGRRWR